MFYSSHMTAPPSLQRPWDKRKISLSPCYWLVSQVRVGNWLTQWQRSHLSHQWQQTAPSSSNFLRCYQIVPMIASSQPGSGSFHDSIPARVFAVTLSLSQGRRRLWLTWAFKGNQQSHLYGLWHTGEMIEMFTLDYSPCWLECNTPVTDKICKHSKPLPIGQDT